MAVESLEEDAPEVPGVRRWDRPSKRGRRGPRRRVRCLPDLPGTTTVFSHANTVGNCARTVRERVRGTIIDGVWQPTMLPVPGAWQRQSLRSIRGKVLRRMLKNALPISREEFACLYRGPKSKVYRRAATRLDERGGIQRKDANIRAFLKAEKWRERKACRLISPASPEYIMELGRFLQPIEHSMYRSFELAVHYPIIMKGRTQEQRAAVIAEHWGSFDEPVAVGLDASKFDQHTSVDALRYEHSFYLGTYANDGDLARLLDWQLRRKVTFCGEDGVMQWLAEGGRMSGDINTALGNCIISASLLVSYAQEIGVRIKCVVDGDDCVAFMERRDLERFLEGVPGFYQELGYRMVVEAPAYELNKVEFCQSRMVFVGDRWLLVRNPLKAIAQDHCWIEKGGLTWDQVLGATGLGGLALYGDVPILCSYYSMLARACPAPPERALDRTSWLRHVVTMTEARRVEPSAVTRASFERSFGIPPNMQEFLERWYDQYDLKAAAHTSSSLIQASPDTILPSTCCALKHITAY